MVHPLLLIRNIRLREICDRSRKYKEIFEVGVQTMSVVVQFERFELHHGEDLSHPPENDSKNAELSSRTLRPQDNAKHRLANQTIVAIHQGKPSSLQSRG
jgi:hypothetical protein